jgi:hypothetical protein
MRAGGVAAKEDAFCAASTVLVPFHFGDIDMWKCIAGVSFALFGLAAAAADRGPQSDLENSPSFGLYLLKSFGGHQDPGTSLTFGFQVHSDASGFLTDETGIQRSWRSLPLVDLRFTGAGNSSFRFYGVTTFDSSDSGTAESLTDWRFWALAAVAVAGVSCAAEWGICDSGGGGHGSSSSSGGSTGSPSH